MATAEVPDAATIWMSPPSSAWIDVLPDEMLMSLISMPYFSNRPISLAIHIGAREPVTEA